MRSPSLAERFAGEGLVLAGLFGWYVLARGLPDFVLPGPESVAGRIAALALDPDFLLHVFVSVWRVIASVILAVVIGAALAVLAWRLPAAEGIVHERIKPFLNSFPSIGWAILAAIWFPPGDFAVLFVQVLILAPFCLINISEGLKVIDLELLEMARSFTRTSPRIAWRVGLPLLAPYLMSAVRISYGIGWKIALVSELLGAPSGLGYLMLRAQTTSDMTTFMAACLVIVFLYTAGERLVILPLERRFSTR
jgi:NitT/TauT family transport system permease protein/sulfonate transport system permease protein